MSATPDAAVPVSVPVSVDDSEHVFAAIAGLAFDTADWGGPNIPAGSGRRWRYDPAGNLADGGAFVARHPPGLIGEAL